MGSINVQTLRAAAITTATDVVSAQIRVEGARKIVLHFNLIAGSAANELVLIPLVSQLDLANTGTTSVPAQPPAVGDPSWTTYGEDNLAATDAALDSGITLMSGADYTKAPVWRHVTLEPLVIRFKPASATSDTISMRIKLDVEGEKWFQLVVADVDSAGTLSNLSITGAVVL